jgi:hypothetical protein
MHILTNAWKLLHFSIILLCSMFPGMRNTVVNDLVQQASGSRAYRGKFSFLEKSDVPVYQTEQSYFQLVHSARICSTEPNSAEPDSPVSESGGSRIFRTSGETSKTMTAGPDDWRTPLVHYLKNLGHIANRKVQRQALKCHA